LVDAPLAGVREPTSRSARVLPTRARRARGIGERADVTHELLRSDLLLQIAMHVRAEAALAVCGVLDARDPGETSVEEQDI